MFLTIPGDDCTPLGSRGCRRLSWKLFAKTFGNLGFHQRRMLMGFARRLSFLAIVAALAANSASAAVYITEWQYNGSEYIEFTNMSSLPVDMTGWSFDDDSRAPGTVSFSPFGIIGAGESFILAEAPEATFRTEWSLPTSVKVIGGNTTNFGSQRRNQPFLPGQFVGRSSQLRPSARSIRLDRFKRSTSAAIRRRSRRWAPMTSTSGSWPRSAIVTVRMWL